MQEEAGSLKYGGELPETALQKGGFQKASGKQAEGESRKPGSLGAFIIFAPLFG